MNIKGTFYFLLFIVLVALSGVCQAHISQNLSPIIFLFFASFSAIILFFGICFSQSQFLVITKGLQHIKKILFLNIANLLGWVCYMYAIKFLEPAIGVIIANASGPILVIIISKILGYNSHIFKIEKIAAIGIIMSLVFIVMNNLLGNSALDNHNQTHIIIGLISAFIAGIGQVLFSIFSKKLMLENFTPMEILVWRFPLILIFSIIALDKNTIIQLSQSLSLSAIVFCLSFFGLVIPIYFYQKSVKLIEPIYISILYILEPVIMFIGQIFDPRLHISFLSYLGVIFIVLFSMLSVIGRYYGTKIHS